MPAICCLVHLITPISALYYVQLSEGVQLDPSDTPPRELLLESPNTSTMPASSVGENPAPSSLNTDYPEPSSAASWARAQHAALLRQQQQGLTSASASGGGYIIGMGGMGYTGSTARPPSSGPYALSETNGPMPPSSRGGVSGNSGALFCSLFESFFVPPPCLF
jgi:hypothetical protein